MQRFYKKFLLIKIFSLFFSIFIFIYVIINQEDNIWIQNNNIVFLINTNKYMEEQWLEWQYWLNKTYLEWSKVIIEDFIENNIKNWEELNYWIIVFEKNWNNYEIPPTKDIETLINSINYIKTNIISTPLQNKNVIENYIDEAILNFSKNTSIWSNAILITKKWHIIWEETETKLKEKNQKIKIINLSEFEWNNITLENIVTINSKDTKILKLIWWILAIFWL